MSADLPARLLRLLALLQGRREWAGPELAERLGVTTRTVRRDMDRLRELGYPVTGTTGTAGGYRLASGRSLPPLALDDDEAVAIAVGLRTAAAAGVAGIDEAAARALVKLEQVLPPRLRQRVASVGLATVGLPGRSGPATDPGVLTVLAAACRDEEVVVFDYRGRDDEPTSRRVEPHNLVATRGRWYLVGFDLNRDDWRTFRLDRVTAPASVRHRFRPRELPGGDAAAYLRASITEAPYRYAARAEVGVAAEQVAGRLPTLLPGKVTPSADGGSTVRLGSDSLELLVRDVLALGGDCVLTDPTPGLLDELGSVAGRLHAVVARSRPGTPEPSGQERSGQDGPSRRVESTSASVS
ncbi:MAG TPA: YafY family protein [Pseudonocardia sp.]